MIKAIVFDCFGVLTSDGWLPFKEKYFKNDPESNAEATGLNALANSGKISYEQFLESVSKLAGVSPDALNREMHKSVGSKSMLAYVRTLKDNYKIGMLSNISGDWLRELFSDQEIALFDAIALSYETGYAKPDRRAYEAVLQRLGLIADECIYIDDQPTFVHAARELGMQGIVFESEKQCKEAIAELLTVSDSNK